MSAFNFRLCLASLIACLAASVFAGPLTPTRDPGDREGQVTDDAEATEATDWAAGAVPTPGRTMELLLEMQKQTPQTPRAGEAGAKAAQGRSPLAARALPSGALEVSTPAQGPEIDPSRKTPAAAAPVIFGSAQAPAIRAQAPATLDWQPPANAATGSSSRPSRPAPEVQPWMIWPAQFIAWVRENRYGVLGAALLTLLLVAGGSALINKRRYAA